MKNYKALIIDDEHFAQQGLKKIIQHALPNFFISIDTASSVKEGVDLINEINPDIVFLDIAHYSSANCVAASKTFTVYGVLHTGNILLAFGKCSNIFKFLRKTGNASKPSGNKEAA